MPGLSVASLSTAVDKIKENTIIKFTSEISYPRAYSNILLFEYAPNSNHMSGLAWQVAFINDPIQYDFYLVVVPDQPDADI